MVKKYIPMPLPNYPLPHIFKENGDWVIVQNRMRKQFKNRCSCDWCTRQLGKIGVGHSWAEAWADYNRPS